MAADSTERECPLVSVVVPTRDRPRLLAIVLGCYRDQSYPNRELIVVDDGEAAPADAAAVAALGGRLVRVPPGTPLGTKLNAGVEPARGTLCQKMDDDDWYAPAFLETMVGAYVASRVDVCRPTLAFLRGFLFFDLARWEVRRSEEANVPGATLLFEREHWQEHPFRGTRGDEDAWFYLDHHRAGGVTVPVKARELYLAVRHRGAAGGRGHTWVYQAGALLDDHLLQRPLHPGGPEALLPAWALAEYRAVHRAMTAGGEPVGIARDEGGGARAERSLLLAILAAAADDPVSLDPALGPSVVNMLLRPADPGAEQLAGRALRALVAGPAAGPALDALQDALADRPSQPLLDAVEHAAFWSPGGLDLRRLLAVAGALGPSERERLVHGVLEPCLLADPAAGREALVELERLMPDHPSLRYLGAYLSGSTPHDDLAAPAAARLGRGPARALVVQNIDDGQGDELIRVGPILEALLTFNRRLEAVVLTARPYLYAHPRVRVVRLDDAAAAAAALNGAYDVVVDFFEPNVLEVNHDPGLAARLDAARRARPPYLLLAADKGHNQFTYQRVDLDGEPLAARLGLDRQRVPNVYETTHRLCAALGLPVRLGERQPGEPIIAGLAWPAADAAWAALVAPNGRGRPVALVNPFGGAEPLKGYVERRLDDLVERLRALLAEGLFVVLAPNGQPWGSVAVVRRLLDRLAAEERGHVGVAPDPADGAGTARLDFPDGSSVEVPHASRQMRQLIYFVRRADLIVTVEGWMVHAAALLGKPYRVLMLPYSHGRDWLPYGRSARQDVWRAPHRGGEGPPLPEQPRKLALLDLLRALGEHGDDGALPLVRSALASEDRDVRLAGAEALGRLAGPERATELVALLDDSSGRVRAAAAAALLELGEGVLAGAAGGRSSATPGPGAADAGPLDRALLRAHRAIGADARDWRELLEIGAGALPALERALADDDPVVRREAAQVHAWLRRRAGA
jgi:ADP-heptose:LPS heptosyltransferase